MLVKCATSILQKGGWVFGSGGCSLIREMKHWQVTGHEAISLGLRDCFVTLPGVF